MAKKSKTTAPQNKQLAVRTRHQKLVRLQREITKQIQQFALTAKELADLDTVAAEKILHAVRGSKTINGLAAKHGQPLDTNCIAAVFQEIASGVQATIRPLRVAFLGPLHSYSHLATMKAFGNSAELIPVRTIRAVFDEVTSGQVDMGVVPIENSTDGRIVDTLDMLTRADVKLCGEVPLRIHHYLLGCGRRDEVTEVCSKPQAMSQCRQWLADHLPNAKLTAISSTTAAAERAAKNARVAAIASRQAGVEYGLKTIAKNIEDNVDNVTRFAVIGMESAKRTGKDKTSLMFELPHQPGALADAMVIFKRNRLNLTWIESFPKPNSPNEYLFFVELVGYQNDMKVRRALAALEKKCVRVEVLGSYAQAPVG